MPHIGARSGVARQRGGTRGERTALSKPRDGWAFRLIGNDSSARDIFTPADPLSASCPERPRTSPDESDSRTSPWA